ncbi:MAG: SpvB/TcaC N-terminal domain-containing protein, partial [Gaiellaceae bacterium]
MREASGTASNLVSLPSGGGGIAPLGDRFQPDLVRGSGSYSVPIACPKGPNELQPSLSLTYSTGSGNGAFGLGWRLDVPRIERRCDRGIPSYTDDDTFVIGDAEVLVDLGGGRFRPKTDTRFWHVERRGDGWRIRTGDGRTLLFGQTAASRESAGERIFAWYLDEERDAAGNAINYSYRRDGGRLYPSEVRYSVFRVRIEYGPRPDRLRTARSGFERLTALRGVAIELHCSRLSPTLMRTYKLSYEEAENGASLLVGISASARQGTQTARLPELGFEYSRPDFATWDVTELRSLLAVPRLDDRRTQLVDLTGDGLPDVLESHDSSLFLWRNRGDGWLEGPTRVAGVPSTMSLESGNVAFADLDGNGRPDLFVADEPLQLAFESDGRGGFRPDPVVFRERPTLALAEPETRLMDVDGDGVTDLLRTGRSSFLLFRHEPGVGWEEPFAVQRDSNLERFPDLSLADTGVRLADMTGDGLQDFVLVTSGNVCYWPYHGNGAWGGRVELERPPELPPGFRDERLQLVDLDGDGCSDLAYLDHDRILIWLNRCGEGFAPPVEVPVAPGNGSVRPPLAADLLGDGRPGFAWTGSPLEEYGSGYRYLRFGEGRKPYLLTAIDNGMGGRTEMAYGTSTAMRLADQGEGLDWQGELPFPVHVVTGIRERDLVSGRSVDLA